MRVVAGKAGEGPVGRLVRGGCVCGMGWEVSSLVGTLPGGGGASVGR